MYSVILVQPTKLPPDINITSFLTKGLKTNGYLQQNRLHGIIQISHVLETNKLRPDAYTYN